ncbi:MAG: hypothetical protein ABIA08_00920 [bacterium]
MQKIKKLFIFTIILIGFLLVVVPITIPSNLQSQEVLKDVSENDFIIIFNPGGWGDVPMSEADDFLPIVQGIQNNLNERGYKTVIIPYMRTEEGLSGKLSGTKDFFSRYAFSSEKFAAELEELVKQFPDKKIILTGLSNGAAFVNETYKRISENIKDSLYAIAVGTPFWAKKVEDKNILQLDNNGRDTLSNGEIGSLFFAAVKAPFDWLISNIKGDNISIAKAFKAKGHDYSWDSPEVNSEIVIFLEEKVR